MLNKKMIVTGSNVVPMMEKPYLQRECVVCLPGDECFHLSNKRGLMRYRGQHGPISTDGMRDI